MDNEDYDDQQSSTEGNTNEVQFQGAVNFSKQCDNLKVQILELIELLKKKDTRNTGLFFNCKWMW